MALLIRMALYYLFGALSGLGWLHWDAASHMLTIDVDAAIPAVLGIAGFGGTFLWSRIAKARGGAT